MMAGIPEMPRRFAVTRLAFVFGAILVLAVPARAANKEMERLAIQMAALQGQLADLQRTTEDSLREIRKIGDALAEQNALLRRTAQDRRGQEDTVQSALKDLSDRVSERLAELDARLQALSAAATAASAPPAASATTPDGSTAPPVAEQAPPPGELYRQAYADYARGSYDLAIQEYRQYLHFYPQTDLSDNAQFWIGECLYGKRLFADAIEAWNELAREYPASDKLPDARFKKALALEQLGKRREAQAELRGVVERYPNSDAGRKARERLGNQ
jgi:tol-pal system protein YbgF